MMKKIGFMIMGLVVIAGLGACAQDYGIKPGGPHFASFTHMGYSLQGEKPRLTKSDFDQAKTEGWWGIPVRYTVDELE